MILYLEMYTYIYKSRYEQLYIHESIFGEKANTLVMHLWCGNLCPLRAVVARRRLFRRKNALNNSVDMDVFYNSENQEVHIQMQLN